jgi:hypothetical protein
METLIVLCLLVVIYLMIEDKIYLRRQIHRPTAPKTAEKETAVMGSVRPVRSQSETVAAKESQNEEPEAEDDTFELDIDEEDFVVHNPHGVRERQPLTGPDLAEEEEEWSHYEISEVDNGFTEGVTFEELSTVEMLLQQEVLEASQKETAVKIVQKIQGTELFSLLESSMEGSSRRIAELLDSSLHTAEDSGYKMRNDDVENFDIGEFV